jgi:glycosyltransferase involved in cell wall biosynthesis
MRNGVDLERFQPIPLLTARDRLGWTAEPTLLSVGNLVELKGHHIAIELLNQLPRFRLAIVGAGPERRKLEQLAEQLGVAQRVVFAGRIEQQDLPIYYSAADILILASSREGWPNVLLEAMACGTPVVATDVGGIPEVVAAPEAGRLVAERSAKAFATAVSDLFTNLPPREVVRKYASQFDWSETTKQQIALFSALAGYRNNAESSQQNPIGIN